MANTPAKTTRNQADRPSFKLVEWLAERARTDGNNLSLEIAARQLDAMLNAQTEEEVWEVMESGGTIAAKNLEDTEIEVSAFIVRPETGQFKAPLGHYIVMTAVKLTTGEDILINSSSPLVIGLMHWYEKAGKLPYKFVIRGDATPEGRRIYFERVPSRVMQGQTVPEGDSAS